MADDLAQSRSDPNPYRPVLIEREVEPTVSGQSGLRTRPEAIDDCFFTAILGLFAPPVFSVISVFMLLNLPAAKADEPARTARTVLAWSINLLVITVALVCCLLVVVS